MAFKMISLLIKKKKTTMRMYSYFYLRTWSSHIPIIKLVDTRSRIHTNTGLSYIPYGSYLLVQSHRISNWSLDQASRHFVVNHKRVFNNKITKGCSIMIPTTMRISSSIAGKIKTTFKRTCPWCVKTMLRFQTRTHERTHARTRWKSSSSSRPDYCYCLHACSFAHSIASVCLSVVAFVVE